MINQLRFNRELSKGLNRYDGHMVEESGEVFCRFTAFSAEGRAKACREYLLNMGIIVGDLGEIISSNPKGKEIVIGYKFKVSG